MRLVELSSNVKGDFPVTHDIATTFGFAKTLKINKSAMSEVWVKKANLNIFIHNFQFIIFLVNSCMFHVFR